MGEPCNMDRDFWWGALVVGWCLCGVALILVGACLGIGRIVEAVATW